MVAPDVAALVPKGSFSDAQLHSGNDAATNLWPSYDASVWLIQRSLVFLGVTRYQLSRLLQTKRPQTVYEWHKAVCRPSGLYLTRLFKLWDMRLNGADPVRMSHIDWDEGEVHWRGLCPTCGVRHWREGSVGNS